MKTMDHNRGGATAFPISDEVTLLSAHRATCAMMEAWKLCHGNLTMFCSVARMEVEKEHALLRKEFSGTMNSNIIWVRLVHAICCLQPLPEGVWQCLCRGPLQAHVFCLPTTGHPPIPFMHGHSLPIPSLILASDSPVVNPPKGWKTYTRYKGGFLKSAGFGEMFPCPMMGHYVTKRGCTQLKSTEFISFYCTCYKGHFNQKEPPACLRALRRNENPDFVEIQTKTGTYPAHVGSTTPGITHSPTNGEGEGVRLPQNPIKKNRWHTKVRAVVSNMSRVEGKSNQPPTKKRKAAKTTDTPTLQNVNMVSIVNSNSNPNPLVCRMSEGTLMETAPLGVDLQKKINIVNSSPSQPSTRMTPNFTTEMGRHGLETKEQPPNLSSDNRPSQLKQIHPGAAPGSKEATKCHTPFILNPAPPSHTTKSRVLTKNSRDTLVLQAPQEWKGLLTTHPTSKIKITSSIAPCIATQQLLVPNPCSRNTEGISTLGTTCVDVAANIGQPKLVPNPSARDTQGISSLGTPCLDVDANIGQPKLVPNPCARVTEGIAPLGISCLGVDANIGPQKLRNVTEGNDADSIKPCSMDNRTNPQIQHVFQREGSAKKGKLPGSLAVFSTNKAPVDFSNLTEREAYMGIESLEVDSFFGERRGLDVFLPPHLFSHGGKVPKWLNIICGPPRNIEECKKIFPLSEQSEVVPCGSYSVTAGVLLCLRPKAWFNDEVIRCFFGILGQKYPRTKFFDPQATRAVSSKNFNYELVKKAVEGSRAKKIAAMKRRGDPLAYYNRFFMACNPSGVHWCLIMIIPASKKVYSFDSWKSGKDWGESEGRELRMRNSLRLLLDFRASITGIDNRTEEIIQWKFIRCKVPLQSNEYDCGPFTCAFADQLVRGDKIFIGAEHMPVYRKLVATSILNGKLHTFK